MKQIFLSTIIAGCFALNTLAQPVKQFGALQVKGTQLCDSAGKPVVLRGMSFGWHNYWPRFYTAGSVNWLQQDWGCTVVRAAIGVEPENGYLQNPQMALEKLTNVVDAAIKGGIYVIIDWHSHNIRQKEAIAFFKEMATKYGSYPNVIYEIFNEPDQESWKDVKAYSEKLIQTIRAVDPDNIILVGSPHWDQDVQLPAADPIKNVSNVMYTMHYYAGTHKQWLRDRTLQAIQQGLPIFISESAGMEATGDGPLDLVEWKAWIDWSEAHKISWITWSVSSKDETCSVLLEPAASDGNWTLDQLKPSGIQIRAILRHLAGLPE